MNRLSRVLALAAFAVVLPSCATWDGHFDIFGYSTKPNYDTRFRSIHVPIAKNHTYWTVTPVPGMEMDLTRALVREIQTKTPYRVKQDDADTELVVKVINFQKNILNYNPFNEIREAETVLTVELYWRDLRTGEILTKGSRRLGDPNEPDPREPLLAAADSLLPQGSKPVLGPATPTAPVPVEDENPVDPATKKKAVPIVMRSIAHFRPELGESITTALQRNIDRMAVQIVSAMECGW